MLTNLFTWISFFTMWFAAWVKVTLVFLNSPISTSLIQLWNALASLLEITFVSLSACAATVSIEKIFCLGYFPFPKTFKNSRILRIRISISRTLASPCVASHVYLDFVGANQGMISVFHGLCRVYHLGVIYKSIMSHIFSIWIIAISRELIRNMRNIFGHNIYATA